MDDENFIMVAQAGDLPEGKMLRIDVDGTGILLVRDQGELYALDDLCSHEDASLVTGCLKQGCVKCPLHGSRFDLKTGLPLDEPATEAINTYKIKQLNGLLYLGSKIEVDII